MPERNLIHRAPVEVIEGATPYPLSTVARAIGTAAAVMLLLGSKALFDWASALPVSPLSDALLDWTGAWQDWIAAIGLDRFAEAIRDWLAAFRSWR